MVYDFVLKWSTTKCSSVRDNHQRNFTKKKIPVPISTVSHKELFFVLTPDVKANFK